MLCSSISINSISSSSRGRRVCARRDHLFRTKLARSTVGSAVNDATCAHVPISGAQTCSVAIADVAEGLRGLVATQDVNRGRILLSLPFSNVLAVPLTQQTVPTWLSTYVQPFEQEWGQIPEDLLDLLSAAEDEGDEKNSKPSRNVRMAALLLYVQRHVRTPFWQLYCAQLPTLEEFTGAGQWSASEVQQLQWPYMQAAVQQLSTVRAAELRQLMQLVTTAPLSKLELVKGSSAAAAAVASWALQVAYTRCHEGANQQLVLVPYEDMANHSSLPVAEFFTATNSHGLIAAEDVQEGQEVVESYRSDADNAELLSNWGFVERGNPSDWVYAVQRPLQLLPRLPWGVVLAAATRLMRFVGAAAEDLLEQEQQLQLSPEALAALHDGRGAVRVLVAAASLPVEVDGALGMLDLDAVAEGQEMADLLKGLGTPSRRKEFSALPLQLQRPLWNHSARQHIMGRVMEAAEEEGQVVQALVMADGPQQRVEATLAALSATLLCMHARLALLGASTSIAADVQFLSEAAEAAEAQEAAPPVLLPVSPRAQAEQADQLLQVAKHGLQACTWGLANVATELAASPAQGGSSGSSQGEKMLGIAQQLGQLMDVTDQLQQLLEAREEQEAAAEGPPSSEAPVANPRLLVAVTARVEQKLLLQMYVLLCDAIMVELNSILPQDEADGEQEEG